MLSLAAVGLVIALVGGGFYIKSQSDAADAQRFATQAALKEKQDQLDSLTKKLQDQMDEATKLQSEYANAKDDAARMAAQQKLAEAQKQAAETRRNISNVQSRPTSGGIVQAQGAVQLPGRRPALLVHSMTATGAREASGIAFALDFPTSTPLGRSRARWRSRWACSRSGSSCSSPRGRAASSWGGSSGCRSS